MLGSREGTAAAGFLCRSLGRIVACLNELDLQEQRWRPPAPATNSLLAIAAHALANAQENVLGLLGGHGSDRQRPGEFDDQDLTADVIRQRWADLEPQFDQTLRQLSPAALAGEVDHPRRGRLTGFEVLVVALRHAAEHMGQAELTRDLVLAQRAAPEPPETSLSESLRVHGRA